MIHPIKQDPISEFPDGNVWEVVCKDHPTCLRVVILRRPDAHPVWHDYVLSLVHLREVPKWPKPNLRTEFRTHELICFALDPSVDNQPECYSRLTPPNLVYQFERMTDNLAKEAFNTFLACLSAKMVSPDTDHRRAQQALLNTIEMEVWEEAGKPVRNIRLRSRAAEALGWTITKAQSLSLQALREAVRPVSPKLAHEITLAIAFAVTG